MVDDGPGCQPVRGTAPSCPILDPFDRADGPLAAPWQGPDLGQFATAAGGLVPPTLDATVLFGTTDYPVDQYVLATVDTAQSYFHLVLRSTPDASAFVYANIHGSMDHVHIGYFDGVNNDEATVAATLLPSDRIAFAAIGDTGVLYLNGVEVLRATLVNSMRFDQGGRIGITAFVDGSGTRIDNFGGGGFP